MGRGDEVALNILTISNDNNDNVINTESYIYIYREREREINMPLTRLSAMGAAMKSPNEIYNVNNIYHYRGITAYIIREVTNVYHYRGCRPWARR